MKTVLFIILSSIICSSSFAQSSDNNAVDYIKAESIGGKLDFNKKLEEEGKKNQLLVFDGVAYNAEDFAILLWGQTVKRLGIRSFKDAAELWETIYKQELTDPDKKALKKGFKIKVE